MTPGALAEDRILPADCGFNVRDFGGYATIDSGRVRTGMLYRAGMMSALADAGQERLAALGIASICDLRSNGERGHRPTQWHEGSATELWARDYAHSSADLVRTVSQATDARQTRELMIGAYRDIAYDHLVSYRAMFAMLRRGKVPLLVNCSAGKDRTGVAVALVLTALGVPRETILADYMLTGRADFSRFLDDVHHEGGPVADPAVIAPLLAVEPEYLATMFAAIERRDGSVEAYLARHLDVDAGARADLRALLVDD